MPVRSNLGFGESSKSVPGVVASSSVVTPDRLAGSLRLRSLPLAVLTCIAKQTSGVTRLTHTAACQSDSVPQLCGQDNSQSRRRLVQRTTRPNHGESGEMAVGHPSHFEMTQLNPNAEGHADYTTDQ